MHAFGLYPRSIHYGVSVITVRHCLLLALIALSAVDDKMNGFKILEVSFSSLESRGLNSVLRLSVR